MGWGIPLSLCLCVIACVTFPSNAVDVVLSTDPTGACAVAPSGTVHCTGPIAAAFEAAYRGPFSQVWHRGSRLAQPRAAVGER